MNQQILNWIIQQFTQAPPQVQQQLMQQLNQTLGQMPQQALNAPAQPGVAATPQQPNGNNGLSGGLAATPPQLPQQASPVAMQAVQGNLPKGSPFGAALMPSGAMQSQGNPFQAGMGIAPGEWGNFPQSQGKPWGM